MLRHFYHQNKGFIDKLLILFCIILFIIAFGIALEYIAPFVFGYLISVMLGPIVSILYNNFKIHRGIAAAVLILVCITLILGIGYFIINRIITEMMLFAQDIPNYIANIEVFFENLFSNFEEISGINLDIALDSILSQIMVVATSLFQAGLERGTTILTTLPSFLLGIMLTIISAFFFIKDKELIKSSILNVLPSYIIKRAKIIKDEILKALYGYFKGQLIVMSIVSSICIIGLAIIGNPYSLFIGLGIGLFDLIPILGAGGILIPWAIYSFLTSNISFGVGLLIIYGVVVLARQLTEPKVVAKQMGIHPIILLISIYIGLMALGFIGVLVGPMVSIAIKTVFEAKLGHNKSE